MKHLILPIAAICTAFSVNAASELPPASPDITADFHISGGKGSVKGRVTAPTMSNDYINPQPLGRISLLEVTRSCWELGESDLPVARFEQAAPGGVYTFEDNDLKAYGYEYTYKAVARNADGEGGYGNYAFVFAGVRPGKPEILSATTSDNGQPPVVFTVRAEATDNEGQPLGMPLTALNLTYIGDDDDETSDVVATVENPVSGQEYTLTFDATEGMTYEFRLVAECEFGRSEAATVTMYVGADSPAAPMAVTAAGKDDGAFVSWTAPQNGRHNGWIDTSATRYRIWRVLSYTNKLMLAEDLEECEYFDPCADLTSVTAIKYEVTAYNGVGEGGTTSSETITVGPSAKLPFIEHFNTASLYSVGPDNLWTYDPDDYNWSCTAYTYASGGATGVMSEDGEEEGYAYCSHTYSYGDLENRMVSTPIDLSDARWPVLSFWYLARPKLDNRLGVAYMAEGEEKPLLELGISDEFSGFAPDAEAEFVWVPRFVEMPEAAGKSAALVFNAIRKSAGSYGSLCIDEILLDDYAPAEVFTASFKDGEGVVGWTEPSNSTGTPTRYDVELDGEEMESVEKPEVELSGVADADHTLRVRAWYGDIPSCWSEAYVFNPLTTGLLTIGAEGDVTEYYDLSGMRRRTFTPGEILIKRTVTADGAVKTSKVRM